MQGEVTLTLTVQELDIMMQCMAKQPYETVHGIISKVLNQVNHQPAKQPPTMPIVPGEAVAAINVGDAG